MTYAQIERQGFNVSACGYVTCDQCHAVIINGIPCHEAGCPNAMHECNGCHELIPMRQRYCTDCA
jgi:hypothetical protein